MILETSQGKLIAEPAGNHIRIWIDRGRGRYGGILLNEEELKKFLQKSHGVLASIRKKKCRATKRQSPEQG